jgi:DNA polymerase-3 subunit gamma/tau
VDPSTAALLARIERLEAALAGARPAPPAPNGAAPPAPAPTPPVSEPAPAPAVSSPPPAPATGDDPGATPLKQAAALAAAPQKPDGPLELQTVAACWPAVIDVVRAENQMLAALLTDARPVALDDQDVTVAFPAGKAFLKRKAEQDDYRRATTEALRAVVGTPLVLRYELRDEPAEPEPEAAGLSHEELVKRLVEEFDAQEVLDDDQETE